MSLHDGPIPMNKLPFLTRDLPAVPLLIKQQPEDFIVEEIPLYDPSGEGTHVYFRIRKRGIPTPEAVQRIAKHMGVKPADIGVAGLKDAQAITEQTLSLEHCDAEKLMALKDPQIKVLWTKLHANKLRPGHLAGNQFTLILRPTTDLNAFSLEAAQNTLNMLATRGVPNYFGYQRFGLRGDTGRLGEALVRDKLDEFIAIFLGGPRAEDPADCRAARDAFDTGAMDRALKRWPRHYVDQRKALSAYKKKNNAAAAIRAIDKRMRRLFVSAFQSEIFNAVLSRRIDEIDQIQTGDLAQKIGSGGIFRVEDGATEQPRALDFEISPTGPLPGSRADLAGGAPGEVERAVLAEFGVDEHTFGKVGTLRVKGARRPLRFALREPTIRNATDSISPAMELRFAAPPGCYATIVVEELTKSRS